MSKGPVRVPWFQYPVLAESPDYCSWRNTNFDYSPVDDVSNLLRQISLVSPNKIFTNVPQIEAEMARGALLPRPGFTSNVIVICPWHPDCSTPVPGNEF